MSAAHPQIIRGDDANVAIEIVKICRRCQRTSIPDSVLFDL
jgi:hypothetical protein